MRRAVCARLGFLGVSLDGSSRVRVVVVPAREDVVAARAARELLAGAQATRLRDQE